MISRSWATCSPACGQNCWNCYGGGIRGRSSAGPTSRRWPGIYSAARLAFNRSLKNDVNMRVFEAVVVRVAAADQRLEG